MSSKLVRGSRSKSAAGFRSRRNRAPSPSLSFFRVVQGAGGCEKTRSNTAAAGEKGSRSYGGYLGHGYAPSSSVAPRTPALLHELPPRNARFALTGAGVGA
jgi:hypothetical protein